jgi:transcriptional regulator with XRE-family HTH domain
VNNHYVEVLRALIHKHNIKQNAIAAKAGINENTLVEVLTGKTSPTVRTLDAVLDACEEFMPGFKLEYHRALLGDKIDLGDFVNSLSPTELAVVLITAGQRVAKLQPTAIAS